MKIISILWLLLVVMLFNSCGNNAETTELNTLSKIEGKDIRIEFVKGGHFTQKKKLGAFEFTITPQIAVWIEDLQGNYLDTLYISKCFGKQTWMMAKYDPDKPFRTSCLPYWMNKLMKAGVQVPTKNAPMPDSVTGATPKGSFDINTKVKKGLTEVVILAEFNKSFDVNEGYFGSEKGYTEGTVNGQPSIIYSALVVLTNSNNFNMQIIGHGGNTGTDINLYKETSNFTTALEMLKSITVKVP